ncbi:substrate-binding periplasmic protein [Marinomonas sp.]|uniref:substrate-binding periplasmic protein n=1 Tax=Marinomonas sp. TaxID=1904862 RepID=UPI003BAC4B76
MRAFINLFIWLSAFNALQAFAEATAPEVELSSLTVRVCGNSAYPPASWVNSNEEVDGVNVAVIKMLLEPLGVTVDIRQNSNWRRCLKEVELGNVDMLSGFKTDRREQFLTFLDTPIIREQFLTFLDTPIIRESIYLYYPIKHPLEFKDWRSLAGLRVGVLMGDSFGNEVDAALREYPSLEFVSNQDQNLLKLADNRLDVVPMGKLSGQLDLNRLGLEGKIGKTASDVSDFWYLGVSKKSPLIKWLPLLNQRLHVLLKDPKTRSDLVKQYQQVYNDDMGLKMELEN